MRHKNSRISILKSWISRTPEGRKQLTQQYETYKKEIRRNAKENKEF